MATIYLQLLGQFQLVYDDVPVATMPQGRLQSLITYLALHRHTPQSRQQLAFHFWPDSSESQARTNLRKHLLYLRRLLPAAEQLFQVDARQIAWQASMSMMLDVEQFETALETAATLTGPQARAALERATTLYTGELLPGCYEEWVIAKREALRSKYLQALERLLLLCEAQRDYAAAIGMAHQLLRHDPLRESVYIQLMRLDALNGDRAAALQVYQTAVTVLRNELEVAPSAELQQAHAQLLRDQIPLSAPNSPAALAQPPFVGRHAEWQQLQVIWRDVLRGHAHLLVIFGEAGIGKSRLAEELIAWAQPQGFLTAQAHAYAAEGQLAYAPVIEWLRTPALKARLHRLEDAWLGEVARLLPELLSEYPTIPPPDLSAASWQRHRLFEALARALLADNQPMLLVLDDLQWCDQETLSWLHFLLRFAPQARLLVVATVRLGEVSLQHPLGTLLPALRNTLQLTEVELNALNAGETAQLAQQMVGYSVDSELALRLYRETEGHPLYIVEMVRAYLPELQQSSHTWPTAADDRWEREVVALPPRIHGVINTRLAQLSPLARNVADLSAVIGRNFTFEVVAHALDSSEDEVVQGLDELLERHIVRERGHSGYDFIHDKIREAIYAKVSGTRRRLLHRRVAQSLEMRHTLNHDVEDVSSQIAVHYDKGNLPERAIPAYERAAQTALRVHAYAEARDLFQRAISLLRDLPSHPERLQLELDLLLRLGTILPALRGYGHEQVRDTYLRAQWITEALGEPVNPAILRALALFNLVRRDLRPAHALGEQLCALAATAGRTDAAVLYAEGHYVLGVTAFWRGELERSQEQLEQALRHYDPQYHNIHTTLYGQDAGVVCRVRLAFTLWFLGFPDQAHQHCTAALAQARTLGHPFTLAYTLNYAAWLYTECRDLVNATAYVSELLAHCEKHSFGIWQPIGLVLDVYGLARQGQIDAGIARIRASIQISQAAALELYMPYIYAVLAQVYALAGAVDQGIATLDEALAEVAEHGDNWYGAELLRLKGNLLQQQGALAPVIESHYQQALELAQSQHARVLALRAAMSLCEFWHQQGKSKQAHRLLASVYQEFEEGFQTTDLDAARCLLAKLA